MFTYSDNESYNDSDKKPECDTGFLCLQHPSSHSHVINLMPNRKRLVTESLARENQPIGVQGASTVGKNVI